jgi:glycosyltransferase involved in cell wall biosynthesis
MFDILPEYIQCMNQTDGVCYIYQSGVSGYANAAKGYIYDLLKKVNVVTKPCEFDQTHVIESGEFEQTIKTLTNNNVVYKNIIVHSTPDMWDYLIDKTEVKIHNRNIIGRTVWEFDPLIPNWVNAINKSIVKIVSVPTEWNKQVFERSGVTKPIIVEPHINVTFPYTKVDLKKLIEDKGEVLYNGDFSQFDLQSSYKFYTIGQYITRKGISETIKAYCESFNQTDTVILFVKTFGFDYSELQKEDCRRKIKNIIGESNVPPIVFLKEMFTYDEIQSLHEQCDCYVQLTRSEGVGLGIFEAYNRGKKVIVTNHGGHVEFLPNNYEGLVDCELVPVKDSIFYNLDLDKTYLWAKPSIKHAVEKIKIMADISSTVSHMTNNTPFPLILNSGWYDLELYQNVHFRWMHLKSSIDVIDNNDYDSVTLVFGNHVNRKTIKSYVVSSHDESKTLVSEKVCEIGEQCYIRIPLVNTKQILIESDSYYCPYESGNSEDRRKLSIMMFKFEFEKNNNHFIQSIESVTHIKDNSHFQITFDSHVTTNTNAHFEYDSVILPNVSSRVTNGILLYLPNLIGKHAKTLDNLSQYKHSINDSKIVVYTDGSIDGFDKYPFEFIQIDPLPIMYDGMMPVHYKYATWAFFEGIKIAKSKMWDYFFCYEWDCMIGKDYWYDTLWQEHLSWPYEPIMTGTPVFKCPLKGVGNLLQGSMDYRYKYSKDCGLYMNIEHVNPTALYTNGALTFYNTNNTAKYFQPELEFYGDVSSYMNTITSWDLEIGIRLFKEYGEKSFEKVGWLPSSYSGCGDYYYNQTQRELMIDTGQKVVIHQYKYL